MGTWRTSCTQPDSNAKSNETETLKRLRVDHSPPLMLNIALALQHVMVQTSLCTLLVGVLVKEDEKNRIAASIFFYSGVSTLLQTCFGSRLPLIQAPSIDFMLPALFLNSVQTGIGTAACRGQCHKSEEFEGPTHQLRELQGMAVVAGLVQISVGLCGVGGAVMIRCGPLILTPVLCMLGFSIYREAALLSSDHWGIAMLTVLLLVFMSQHLRYWSFSASGKLCPAISMLSVMLSMLLVWVLCTTLHLYRDVRFHSVPELFLKKNHINTTLIQDRSSPNSSVWVSPNTSMLWFRLPLPGLGLPLLTGYTIAAGVAAGLSCSLSSLAVYVLTARLLKAPAPPAQACNRGLSVEGVGTVLAGLMGAPVGLCSSVSNACTAGLSQCGSRATVQLAGVMLLFLGVFPPLTQLLISVPLAIHGAVLSVTHTVAVGTGITYLQYTDVDSGRNIFNTGFTVFMSLVLTRWFRNQSGFICTGVPGLDIFLQSCLMLPGLLVSILAFFLDHTVSGTLSERGLEHDHSTGKIHSLADKQKETDQSPVAVYKPPELVKRLLDLPWLRYFPFCACRSSDMEEFKETTIEMTGLLPH
ncbi:solute carrier family 23 member 3 [Trichomycterus rosablanca]|uniref:solute carrier family 23 member 3 n=1 Tax=Trichomycterus rosablanca TaxID=2290929 RepID=UPI002F359D6D